MTALTLPQARIPLAWVMVNGTRMPAEIDIEWMRALVTLVNRSGGVVGNGNTGITFSAESMGSVIATRALIPHQGASQDVRGDSSIGVTRDAQGYKLALVSENLVEPLLPFLPRNQLNPLIATDASRVLETQIFGD